MPPIATVSGCALANALIASISAIVRATACICAMEMANYCSVTSIACRKPDYFCLLRRSYSSRAFSISSKNSLLVCRRAKQAEANAMEALTSLCQ